MRLKHNSVLCTVAQRATDQKTKCSRVRQGEFTRGRQALSEEATFKQRPEESTRESTPGQMLG